MSSDHHRRVLFAERAISGHRLYYLRLVATEALRRGYSVVVALPKAAEKSPEFAAHLAGLSTSVDVVEIPEVSLASLSRLTNELAVDRTIVMDGDGLALEIAQMRRWRGRGKISILIMREQAQPSHYAVKKLIHWVAKKLIIFAASARPYTDVAVLKSATWPGTPSPRVAIDPIILTCSPSDVSELKNVWELSNDVFWFAILGAITERKNVPIVAAAIASLPFHNVGLLVAGSIQDSLKQELDAAFRELATSGKRCVVVDRTLTDLELDSSVSAADCLVLAHSNEGPSGLLGKAALSGTRIIASGAKSLRRDVKLLNGSAEWTPLEVAELSQAMKRALTAVTVKEAGLPSAGSFVNAVLPADR